jgi:hypothetical protein
MRRRWLAVSCFVVVSACSANATCPTGTCQSGLTFLFRDLAATFTAGTKQDVTVCLDGSCKTLSVDRTDAGERQFVAFSTLDGRADHDLSVALGSGAPKQYRGAIATLAQTPNGKKCAGQCAVGTVKVDQSGAPLPGTPQPASTTTVTTG